MSLIDDIKNQVKKSGTNKSKFIYFKPGSKIRVRFLNDMEEGHKVLFHDSFALGINVPCQELFGRTCPHCEEEGLRHRDLYAWSVFDYEAKEVKILLGAINNFSPIPLLVGMYDTYGTLVDRDYVITKNGTGTSASFSVVPMDKVRFRNEKAKPYSESKFNSLLDKAFPDDVTEEEEDEDESPKPRIKKGKKKPKPVEDEYDDEEDDDEDEEEAPKKKAKKKKPTPPPVEEEDDDDEDEDEEDYEDMSPLKLYKICKSKGIKVATKKKANYYITKLMDNDEEEEEVEW